MSPTPQVLFVCVHNAGRSQMAAAERGIDGIERMRLIRDDIDARVQGLARELVASGA